MVTDIRAWKLCSTVAMGRKAVKWYTKATVQWHASMQTWLGVMYELGWGIKEDN